MAGYQLTVSFDGFLHHIAAIKAGLHDATPLMRVWGEIIDLSIAQNFEQGGRPKWQPLSAVTIALKGHARPLIGKTGNLARIVIQPGTQSVLVGTQPAARAYAAIQQFGGQAGRGQKVRIPARPYLLLQTGDVEEMAEEARFYLERISE